MNDEPGLQFPRSWLRGKFGVFPSRIVTELASLVVTNDPVVEIVVRNNVNGRNHRQTPHYVPRCCNTEEGAVIKINFVPVRENCSKLTIIKGKADLTVEFPITAGKPIRGFCPRDSDGILAAKGLTVSFAISSRSPSTKAVLPIPATGAVSNRFVIILSGEARRSCLH
jgi:hypothetical protein